ncbi:PAS domain S-box protein [Geobacter sp.]|uniref:PAS domain S-box protein n=1 Tax=Geobacter sp. TaxID=46610 RepID=UPI002605E6C7|nr:PAS domain S-box protein [Geobacter sp.]
MKSFRSSIPLSVSAVIAAIALATGYFVIQIDGEAQRQATVEQMRVGVIAAAILIAVIFALAAGAFLAARRRTVRELELKEAAIASSVTAIAFCDTGCRLTYANRAFREMWGFGEEDELLGRQTTELWEYPEDAKAVTAEVLANGHWSGELIGRRKDGRTMFVRLTASLIPGGDGCGASLVGSFVDVTETRRAERLREGEQRIMALIAGEVPLTEVLEQICLTIEGQSEGGLCSVLLADADGSHLRHGAAPSLPDDYNRIIDGTRIGPAVGSCGTAAHERRQVIVADIATDPLWAKYRKLPLAHGLRASWSSPIFASTGELLGTFALYYRTVRRPTDDELRLIERAASLASIAIERAREREALEANIRFLKVLIDTIPSPVYYKNSAGVYLTCNRAFMTSLGVREEEVVGKTIYDLLPREVAESYAEMDRQLISSPGIQVFESNVTWVDGSHEVMFTKATFCHQDGRVEGIVGIIVDITKVKNAEREIRALQRQQQAILDNIPDLVWLKDAESRFIAVNEAFARSCNSTPAALVGKDDLDVWPRDLAELYRQDDRQVMALRQRKRIEEPLEEASGERRWIETIKTPVIDEGGNVVGTTGIARDIEGRKRAEEALRESEERFRGLFEQNEDAIVLLRRESFKVLDVNPAAERLFGYSRDELGRQSPWSFFSPEAYATFIRAVPPRGESAPFYLDRLGTARKSGEAIIVSIWGKIIRLRDEEVIYCSIRNITDRVRLEEESRNIQARLIHANKMTSLGILVSGIAHEINNPNTFIQGNAGILERIWLDVMPLLVRHRQSADNVTLGGLPADEVERIVPRLLLGLREGSRRISAIVGNLKNFAREDKAAGHAPIDVNKIIRDAALILSHHIHRHTDIFQLRLDDTLPPALGKAQQVEQVVINLIMNGLQALPGKEAGLTVATRVDRAAAAVVITVRDEGEGMSGEVMARLTEPFFSTRLERGGTGLGLSICASIMEEHDGALRFESSPGAGTTATVTLPLAPPGASPG